jgi:hypothetical protein
MCGGDASRAMQLLANTSAVSGLTQWLLNPTFGELKPRAAASFGRRFVYFLPGITNEVYQAASD